MTGILGHGTIGAPSQATAIDRNHTSITPCHAMPCEGSVSDRGFWRLEAAMPEEVWKPVVGWEDRYEVSSQGRVRRTKASKGARVGNVLNLIPHSKGYWAVTLCRPDEPQEKHLVHRLMVEAFLGPLDGHRMEVNHKNGVKADNRLENLERVSHRRNCQHAYDTGLNKRLNHRGEKSGSSKLTEAQVLEVRQRLANGERGLHIAKALGVGSSTIYGIKNQRSWEWLE